MSDLTWLVENSRSITATSILLMIVFVVVVGAHKQWWVPGWIYRQCISDKDASVERERKLRDEIDDVNRDNLARLRVLEDVTSSPRRSRSSSKGAD